MPWLPVMFNQKIYCQYRSPWTSKISFLMYSQCSHFMEYLVWHVMDLVLGYFYATHSHYREKDLEEKKKATYMHSFLWQICFVWTYQDSCSTSYFSAMWKIKKTKEELYQTTKLFSEVWEADPTELSSLFVSSLLFTQ